MSQYYYNTPTQHGSYQFTSIHDIISNFMVSYVGYEKIIPTAKRHDVAFHAQRALQELTYDTLKSCKSQEITVPSTLQMILPHDYVNYTKVSWVDSKGIKHLLYPTSKTSNPTNPTQNSDGEFRFTAVGTLTNNSSSITLDGEYTDIEVGWSVLIPNKLDGPGTIDSITTTGGVTTITLISTTKATVTGDAELNFSTANNILQQPEESVVLDGVSYTNGKYVLTAASAADAAKVKPGWSASHDDFSTYTHVVSVTGDEITINNAATTSSTSSNVNFVSNKYISDTWASYRSSTPSENDNDDYQDDTYWPAFGGRYGLDPQHAQANGSFYIDCKNNKIHFSSNISGKTVILDYISDGLYGGESSKVPKFVEEAIYKWIAHAILASRANTPEFIVARIKKERFAEIRKAKLRLSNIKLEEITQTLRGKSKQIKH